MAVDKPAEAEFDPYDPAVVGPPLLTELLGATPLPPWVDQLDPISVYYGEEGGIGKEEVTELLVGGQQALEPCALRQGEPFRVVPAQPAIEGTEGATLQGEEEADGDQLAGVELSLRMFGEVADPVLVSTRQKREMIRSKVVMGLVPPSLVLFL